MKRTGKNSIGGDTPVRTRRAARAGWLAAVMAVAALVPGGCELVEEDEDCQEAERIWGEKTQYLGEECASGSYGGCPVNYDDCIEGECRHSDSANNDICTMTCSSDSECLGDYCKDGICQPGASCSTYCDGYCCCEYHRDPNDPTECVQGQCTCV